MVVEITPRLGTKLRDFADVTFSITVSADAPPDRVRLAMRRVWDALCEVGSSTPLPTGDLPTPPYVSQPAGRLGDVHWTITVDFDFAPREERTRVPDLIAGILREFEVTPARLDVFVDGD